MIEYAPWSKKILSEVLVNYTNKKLTVLDIQLGGSCNFSCIYCDTPDRRGLLTIDIDWIKNVIEKHEIKWVFICGAGEPTHMKNISYLKKILEICKSNGAKCSIFTNLSVLDEELKKYIANGTLNILFKLDTLNYDKVQGLFKPNSKDLDLYFRNIQEINDLVSINDGFTNIAASIVPTRINENEIIKLVDYCFSKGIFPLIGDLEKSGFSIEKYDELKISEEELQVIKNKIELQTNSEYWIPICPSVIGGIHIDCSGRVIVDEATGLSCHWFWLKEPKVKTLTTINSETTINSVSEKIFSYRTQQLLTLKNTVDEIPILSFGGCGGNVKSLLEKYLEVHEKVK